MPTQTLTEAEQPVTVCVRHTVKPGYETTFERELADTGRIAASFPGHLGMNVIRPSGASREYVTIFRFDTYEHLQAWENSSECTRWRNRVGELTEGVQKQMVTGLEYWFNLPGNAASEPPPAPKMMVVTFVAIFPLSLFLPPFLLPFLTPLPSLLQSALITITMIVTMTYAAMPLMIRIFSGWLFPKRSH